MCFLMPWTFAHPAAVLPLRPCFGGNIPFAALFIGSLTPDAFYYGGRFWLAVHAHSVLGWFWLCLPVGLVCYALLQSLKQPLIAMLPDPHRTALEALPIRRRLSPVRELAWVSSGIVIGAATHGIWDAATHSDGFIVERWDFLKSPLFTIYGHYFPVYNLLQHTSTVVGFGILVIVYVRYLRPFAAGKWISSTRADMTRYVLLALGSFLALGLGYWYTRQTQAFVSHTHTLIRTVVYTTTFLSFMVGATALYLRYKLRGRPPTATVPAAVSAVLEESAESSQRSNRT